MKIKARIKVDFLPGDDIKDAFIEATRLAKLLSVHIEFNFNGIHCHVSPGGDSKKGVIEYFKALENKTDMAFN